MKHGKMLMSLLLTLTMLLSMSAFALAEEVEGETAETPAEDAATEEVVDEEAAAKMTVRCVDADGATIRDQQEDYLDLSKDQVLDEKSTRPNIEGYTYQKTMVGTDEIVKLTVSHDDSGAVVTATVRQSGVESEKKLTGSETVLFVYEKVEEHTHSFDEGKVTTEPSCTEKRTCKRDASHTESETVKPAETVTKEATCTEKGEKSLKATFTGEAFAEQSKTAEIPALGHDFAHGRCKVCDEIDPDFKPTITDETKGMASWGTNYVMYSDAYYKDFQKVLVDGRQLAATNYTVTDKDGLICVTLKGDYVRRLKVGVHKLSIVGETGTGEISVTIASKPKTGDENNIGLWIGILAGSAVCVGAAAFFIIRKSKKDQN